MSVLGQIPFLLWIGNAGFYLYCISHMPLEFYFILFSNNYCICHIQRTVNIYNKYKKLVQLPQNNLY